MNASNILIFATTILVLKIALIYAFGTFFVEAANSNNYIGQFIWFGISALTLLAIVSFVLTMVVFFKKQRGWKVYLAMLVSLLAFAISPTVYVL